MVPLINPTIWWFFCSSAIKKTLLLTRNGWNFDASTNVTKILFIINAASIVDGLVHLLQKILSMQYIKILMKELALLWQIMRKWQITSEQNAVFDSYERSIILWSNFSPLWNLFSPKLAKMIGDYGKQVYSGQYWKIKFWSFSHYLCQQNPWILDLHKKIIVVCM